MESVSTAAKEERAVAALGNHHDCIAIAEEGLGSPAVSVSIFSMPKAVYFIIGNEFCERFSFYGMKTILPPYLQFYLGFSEDSATAIIHSFIFFAYAVTLFGGILSDSYLGKYKTILYLSLVYCMGNAAMSATSIPGATGVPPHWWGMALSLLLIAIGTGGIKPCVSSFGGDHFRSGESVQIALYFSMFYFAINSGSLLSMAITPILRDTIGCFGDHSCYPLAFGVPAALMMAALLIFVSGGSLYRKVPPTNNMIVQIFRVVLFSARMHFRRLIVRVGSPMHASYLPIEESNAEASERAPLRRSFFDVARLKYSSVLVDDIESLLGVLKLLVPVVFFWSVYDQQSSRWTYQGYTMDPELNLFGFVFHVKAEQMQIWNAIFILIMIPLFERIVYPALRRLGIRFRPLDRIITGMSICALTFILVAALQWRIDQSVLVPDLEHPGALKCIEHCVPILAQVPQYVLLTMAEILVSITGLEFAYSQAPASMKSVCSAFWLLTVAFGNLVVIVLTWLDVFGRLGVEHVNFWNYLLYATLLIFATLVLGMCSRHYRYAEEIRREKRCQEIAGLSLVHRADEDSNE